MKQRMEDIRVYIEMCNVPIKFWGKVMDQDNQPLEGAKISGGVMHGYITISGEGSSKDVKYTVHTDVNGNFTIEGMKGFILGIDEVQKEGYELSKQATTSFSFGVQSPNPFVPDANQPVVFRMWKKGSFEPLVAKNGDFGIPYDGTSVVVDLISGKKTNDGKGDIRVTLTRNPLQIKVGQKNFEWHATIEAVDGGIIESVDEFMNRAPVEGYQSKIEKRMLADDPKWCRSWSVDFYLKSRGGQCYGRVNADLFTDSERSTTGFYFKSFLNPAGSRNLEYDSSKYLSPNRIEQIGLKKAIEEVKDKEAK